MYCENISSSCSTNAEKKSGAGEDPHPFWTLLFLIFTLSSATFPLKVRIIISDPFSDGSSFYVVCVCSHCRQTKPESLENESYASYFMCLRRFLFLSLFFSIGLLELLSFD